MKSFSSFSVLALAAAFLFQGCQSTGSTNSKTSSSDSIWNNRIGNYTSSQAISEYGEPKSRKDAGNGLTEMYWEQNELYDSSKSAPQTVTVNKYGQPRSDTQNGVISFQTVKLTLLFDKEGKLRSWQRK